MDLADFSGTRQSMPECDPMMHRREAGETHLRADAGDSAHTEEGCGFKAARNHENRSTSI